MKKRKFNYPVYDGPLSIANPEAYRIYHAYNQQVQRCTNPAHKSYSYYGARGIRVRYTVREYIGWYLYQLTTKQMKKPTCGRIDHSKDYTLDNIELVERSDNTREVNNRLGSPRSRQVKILAVTKDGIRLNFDSEGEAARVVGVARSLLVAHLSGQIANPIPQLVFSYSQRVVPGARRKKGSR